MNTSKKSGGSKKYGRNKRNKDQALSLYVRNKISFNEYEKMRSK